MLQLVLHYTCRHALRSKQLPSSTRRPSTPSIFWRRVSAPVALELNGTLSPEPEIPNPKPPTPNPKPQSPNPQVTPLKLPLSGTISWSVFQVRVRVRVRVACACAYEVRVACSCVSAYSMHPQVFPSCASRLIPSNRLTSHARSTRSPFIRCDSTCLCALTSILVFSIEFNSV